MGASIDAIDEAIYAALGALRAGPVGAGTVATLARYAGQVTRARGVNYVTLGKAPALLLACPGGDAVDAEGVTTLLGGNEEAVDRLVWLVYVVVQAPQGDQQAIKGAALAGQLGLYRLVSQVQGALHGLAIDGLYQDHPLRYVGWRWHEATEPGQSYVAAVRFVADTTLDAPDPAETTNPLSVSGQLAKRGGLEDELPADDTSFLVTP